MLHISPKVRQELSVPLPGSGARNINEVTHERFLSMRKSFMLPRCDGGELEWELIDPVALVCRSVAESPRMANAVRASLAATPCSMATPWTLVVGYDEFAPGNKLKTDNRRKTMVLSITFAEFGQAAFCY